MKTDRIPNQGHEGKGPDGPQLETRRLGTGATGRWRMRGSEAHL